MMQVAAEDTYVNYVLCRGFDVRIPKFIDYDAGDLANSPGIPVAKPFGNRRTGAYQIAQIFPAVLPLQIGVPSPVDVPWRVGQNPGVAATCPGHPCDLDEAVEILYAADGKVINWMMLDGSSVELRGGCLDEDHPGRGIVFDIHLGTWTPASDSWTYDTVTIYKAIDHRYGVPYPLAGATGLFWPRKSTTYGTVWETVALDCSSPGPC